MLRRIMTTSLMIGEANVEEVEISVAATEVAEANAEGIKEEEEIEVDINKKLLQLSTEGRTSKSKIAMEHHSMAVVRNSNKNQDTKQTKSMCKTYPSTPTTAKSTDSSRTTI